MLFTGNTYKSIPTTQKIKFEFRNIAPSSSGYSVMGFSGDSSDFSYLFSGGKVFDSKRKYIYSSADVFDISGIVEEGLSQTFVNDEKLATISGTSNSYKNFYVNVYNSTIYSDVYISVPVIDYGVVVSPTYYSQGSLGITIQNNSSSDFRVFGYSVQYDNNANTSQFSGSISGTVSGSSSNQFFLQDVTDLINDKVDQFDLTLDTNFGQVTNTFSTSRISGFDIYNYALDKITPDLQIGNLFFGQTGLNSFSFSGNDASGFLGVQVGKFDSETGAYESGVLSFSFDPVYPTDGQTYTAEYVTSIQITATGRYDTCPEARYREYYYVSDLTLDSNTILSTGCTGVVTVLFSGFSGFGAGASGYLLTRPYNETDTLIYSGASYKVVTGAVINKPGSGYITSPYVYLGTGAGGSSCFDFALRSGDRYPYSAFSGTPELGRNAGYLTGYTVCEQTGSLYYVSGVVITNPGSGYSSTFYPTIQFARMSGDLQTGNASGTVSLNNQSKSYSFYDSWLLSTGFNSNILSSLEVSTTNTQFLLTEDKNFYFVTEDSGYALALESSSFSGLVYYPDALSTFFFNVVNKSIDYTGNLVAKLDVVNEGKVSGSFYITGSKLYSTDPNLLLSNTNLFANNYTILDFLNGGLT